MVNAPEECGAFAAERADALSINIGTLTAPQLEAMLLAAGAFSGIVSRTLTAPLDRLKLLHESGRYHSILAFLRNMCTCGCFVHTRTHARTHARTLARIQAPRAPGQRLIRGLKLRQQLRP